MEFTDEWSEHKFENIFDIKNGLNKGKDYFGEGIRILNYMDVNKYELNTENTIKGLVELTDDEIERYSVKPNDLFFTRTSETSEEIGLTSAYMGNTIKCVFSGFLLRARPKIDLNSLFFAYYLRSPRQRNNIIKFSSITTRALISGGNLSKMKIKYPSIEEQNKIANLFLILDKKVELLEKKYREYQCFKKYLMQKLFAQELRFADCTGEWNLFKLGDIVELMRNGCSKNQVSFETEFPVTRIETISKGILNFDKVGYVEKIDSSYLLQYGDILLSNINSLKYIGNCVFFDEDKPLYHGMNLMLMRFKDDFNKKYLFYYMKFYQQWFQKMACQAVNQASINQSSLKKFPFYIPPTIDEQNKIVNVIDDTEHKINSIEDQIIKMEEFKKGLLQQMFVVQLILSLLQNKKHI